MTRHTIRRALALAALAGTMFGMQGVAGEAPPGCDARGGVACAATACGVGVADGDAFASGDGAEAHTTAFVAPLTLAHVHRAGKPGNHAFSTTHAAGEGIGFATAYATANGASAASDCPLFEGAARLPPALAHAYGCLARAGDAEAAYAGTLQVDPRTGAAWFVGAVARGGVEAPFAAPATGGLVLTAAHAASAAPPGLEDSGWRLRAAFWATGTGTACRAALED